MCVKTNYNVNNKTQKMIISVILQLCLIQCQSVIYIVIAHWHRPLIQCYEYLLILEINMFKTIMALYASQLILVKL